MLTGKDIAGVNDKVTALTSDALDINNAAKDLKALHETGTPTDQLAAVFKFMKALDPGSVVKEDEQTMAKTTGGPADALVGMVNDLQGEGGLTKQAFGNLVNTAILLANSASDASGTNLSGYLDVLSDKIPLVDLEKMQSRSPGRIESIEVTEATEAPATPPTPEGTIIVNKGTGERRQLVNGQWTEVK
jgi:hypothetical protein